MSACEAVGRSKATRVPWGALSGLIALSALLRFHDLDSQSFWSDEIGSLQFVRASFGETLDGVARDVHPPLYFLLLHAWTQLFGISEFSVRALSALPGVLAVAPFVLLGRRLFGIRAGVLAGALLAVSLLHVYYAQEARGYSWLVFFAIGSMEAFVGWRQRRRSADAIRYVAMSAGLVYTHYFGFFLLLAQNAWVLGEWGVDALRQRRSGRASDVPTGLRGALAWCASQAAVGVCFAPWLPIWLEQTRGVQAGFWIRESSVLGLYKTPLIFASVLRPPWGRAALWNEIGVAFALLVPLGLLASFCWEAAGNRRWLPEWLRPGAGSGAAPEGGLSAPNDESHAPGGASRAPDGWSRGGALVAVWLVVPVLVPWLLSAVGLHIYTYRNVIVASPALLLAMAAAISRVRGRLFPVLLMAAAMAPSVGQLPWYFHTPHKDQWRELVQSVEERLDPGRDGVVFDAPFIRRNYDFYASRPYFFVDVRGPVPKRPRIWLIRAHTDETAGLVPLQLRAWGYRRVEVESLVEIELWRYARSLGDGG